MNSELFSMQDWQFNCLYIFKQVAQRLKIIYLKAYRGTRENTYNRKGDDNRG